MIVKIVLLLLGDILLLYTDLALVLLVRYAAKIDYFLFAKHLLPFSIIFGVWIMFFGAFGLYDLRFLKNSKKFLYRLLYVMVVNTVVAVLIFYLAPVWDIEPRRNLLIIVGSSTILLFAWRFLFNLITCRGTASYVLFFGEYPDTIELVNYLHENPQLGQKPVGFIIEKTDKSAYNKKSSLNLPRYLFDQNIIRKITNQNIDTIVISSKAKQNPETVKVLIQLLPLGINIVEFPAYYEMFTGKVPLFLIREVWFLENLIGMRNRRYEFFKRAADITLSLLFAIPTLLTMPLIALAIKLDSEGSIFYKQKRVGRHGREFWIIKYRTMVKNAEKMGGYKGTSPDPRQTRVGAFLRKSYLDELPQLWNIFKGEMSFVGPRPERPEYVEKLKNKVPFYEMRLLVQPGITGWAQINMEDDASVEDAPEKMQYDLYYIKNRSLILDAVIMLRTLSAILQQQGR